ncbi:DUF1707 domain-containing protein [Micromonospora cathayae]|uniref:DUF1707 domain-containing protein n=1 Tax=Micromonospora cathayae TaxID=3028804 RepID=A0ABY7ZS83_9ACTN|nr:DUF1707 domain-containing protein [Micromonospora sp. HUAS 3]WDZ85338.1 DUF1707 domain-containing protein [Micromonospora sp. HUAS 3]
MDRRDGMRAADADREAVAGRLRVALDEGRLDLHEYDDRLQRAYLARTYGELDVVLADLPDPATAAGGTVAVPQPAPGVGGGVVVSAPAGKPVAARSATVRWLVETWEPYLTVVAVTVAVWAVISVLDGGPVYFWPGWVAGPWGAILVVQTALGLVRGEPERWVAEQERKRLRKAEKREQRRRLKAERQERELTAAGEQPGAGELTAEREQPGAGELTAEREQTGDDGRPSA